MVDPRVFGNVAGTTNPMSSPERWFVDRVTSTLCPGQELDASARWRRCGRPLRTRRRSLPVRSGFPWSAKEGAECREAGERCGAGPDDRRTMHVGGGADHEQGDAVGQHRAKATELAWNH